MPHKNAPYVVNEKPRTVAWCSCGESESQPYCDGAHARKNTGKRPVIVELKEEKTVAWCGCKQSGNKPYCDGAHAKLPKT